MGWPRPTKCVEQWPFGLLLKDFWALILPTVGGFR